MSAQLTQAVGRLTALLDDRARGARRVPAPVVVPLGAADTLDAERDVSAGLREHALVHLTPDAVLVGPWGTPAGQRSRACGRCLARRWQQVRGEHEREALELGGETSSAGSWPVLMPYLADAVWELYQAVLVSPQVAAAGPAGASRVSWIDLSTMRLRTVPVIADPLCPDCADAGKKEGAGDNKTVSYPKPSPKPSPASYRARPPGSYPLPVEGLVNPVCGVLGPQAQRQLDSPTTAPVLGRILKRGRGGLNEMTWSGQGRSYRASRDLALLEGLERYASVRLRRPGAVVTAAYEAVSDFAVDPRSCGSYSPQAYAAEPELRPFDPARETGWVWGYSLTRQRAVLVPLPLAYYSMVAAGGNYLFETSSGCASGASLAEAALFGLLELIERDAFLLGWYGGAQLTEIDLSEDDLSQDGAGGTELRSLLDRAGLLGYEVHAFDNRVDLDIPVVTCLAVRPDRGDGTIGFAAAASLDPGDALRAAAAEVLTHIPRLPGTARRRGAELRAMMADFTRVTELRDHAELFGLPEMAVHASRYLNPVSVQSAGEVYAGWALRRPRTTDLLDDLRYCQSRVEQAGLEVIVVDQTCAEQRAAGLRTARVIVPGLLPIDFGWSRQRALRLPRLLTAFRRAGWRDTDLTPADLHLIPHPFP